ncbi:MAG: preprotein translocase subunit SecE [Clostridia bacterium]|nr:preprotein translocase subunit SecE [Clostridia bacterium]MBR2296028.1 preprotein translocase subunit SecE [Clostridia bacterium]
MAENESKKQKKPGFFSRLGQKLKNLKSEFKKVTWASPKSVFKSFLVVIVCTAAIALALGILDLGLMWFFNFLAKIIPAFSS